jgi:hypothetical protein
MPKGKGYGGAAKAKAKAKTMLRENRAPGKKATRATKKK